MQLPKVWYEMLFGLWLVQRIFKCKSCCGGWGGFWWPAISQPTEDSFCMNLKKSVCLTLGDFFYIRPLVLHLAMYFLGTFFLLRKQIYSLAKKFTSTKQGIVNKTQWIFFSIHLVAAALHNDKSKLKWIFLPLAAYSCKCCSIVHNKWSTFQIQYDHLVTIFSNQFDILWKKS